MVTKILALPEHHEFVEVYLHDNITWYIKDADSTLKINDSKYTILNPTQYSKFVHDWDVEIPEMKNYKKGLFVATDRIIFQCKNSEFDDVVQATEDCLSIVESLVNVLKIVFYQEDIRNEQPMWSNLASKKTEVPNVKFIELESIEKYSKKLGSVVYWDEFSSYVTDQAGSFTLAIYDEILFDLTIEMSKNNYRKAILFAANAIEVFLRNVYNQIHTKNFEIKDPTYFRYIAQPDGVTVDPFFLKLEKNCNFKELIHDVMYYITETSFKLETPGLYRDALKVYQTRNKIIHNGYPPDTNAFLKINAEGALLAYKTCIGIVKRFTSTDYLPVFYNDPTSTLTTHSFSSEPNKVEVLSRKIQVRNAF